MRYYPIHLDLKDQPVLVVGGGAIAEGKAEQLREAGAKIFLVSPTLTPRLESLVEEGAIRHRAGAFAENDLLGVLLVISATDDQAVNREVHRLATACGLLCNVVDQPALCNFITPALVVRGELQISISTGGGSPSVAQLVKRRIAEAIGEEYGDLLRLAAKLREELKARGVGYNERRDLINAFLESEVLTLLQTGRQAEAELLVSQVLARLDARQ
ncbi:MAG: bifunctional precorrin-2 dehydrogenase/sirohydrochlorin ferrochelatase [Blastocatellia bacterium]